MFVDYIVSNLGPVSSINMDNIFDCGRKARVRAADLEAPVSLFRSMGKIWYSLFISSCVSS